MRQVLALWFSKLQALGHSGVFVEDELENIIRIDRFYRIYD
jgi:hypothetical protein